MCGDRPHFYYHTVKNVLVYGEIHYHTEQSYTSFFALKMEKSGLRTVAKPPGDPIFQENAVFLLEKHEIAAFVLVDKSGYFCGFPGKIWDNEAVEYKDCAIGGGRRPLMR